MPVMVVNNENEHEQAGDYRSRPRWSAGKKMDAVLRLLRGEPLPNDPGACFPDGEGVGVVGAGAQRRLRRREHGRSHRAGWGLHRRPIHCASCSPCRCHWRQRHPRDGELEGVGAPYERTERISLVNSRQHDSCCRLLTEQSTERRSGDRPGSTHNSALYG